MGLVSEEVEIKWSKNNKQWYESQGYIFTYYGDEFRVKVEDLTEQNSNLIEVKCDNCGGKVSKPIQWRSYNKYIKQNKHFYCDKCKIELFSQSFYDWCIKNNFLNIITRWDTELNKCDSKDVSYCTSKKYYFKCPEGIHPSELKDIHSFVSNLYEGTMECKACNSFGNYLTSIYGSNAIDEYWDYELNKSINIWKLDKCSGKKVFLKCVNKDYHNSYPIRCADFVKGDRCPYCSNRCGKVHLLDSLGTLYPQVLKIWSDKNNIINSYEYAPMSTEKIWWKCPNDYHEDYYRSIIDSNKANFRCPECEYSKGEERISNYFINKGLIKISEEDYKVLDNVFKMNYNYYIPQKKFDKLIGLGGGNLSYDFYLPNLQYNLLIEYDGEFHYKPIRKYKNEPIKYAEERLKKQQEHDRLKTEYAEKHNIKLLRIPYWDFDNIEKILNEYLNKTLINAVI